MCALKAHISKILYNIIDTLRLRLGASSLSITYCSLYHAVGYEFITFCDMSCKASYWTFLNLKMELRNLMEKFKLKCSMGDLTLRYLSISNLKSCMWSKEGYDFFWILGFNFSFFLFGFFFFWISNIKILLKKTHPST